ncbi:VOC family protein [Nakamurella deserti]|uniref:2-oxoadipate dioxygenase/decarboxylase n=1 Tax=Nakamurella deserti TaxID=2164074 RepID=UPI000DBE1758|nr:VOC family protein [Nakamurella deserti]
MVTQWQLRSAFAQRLSDMYGREVPAYTTLVDVSREVNAAVIADLGPAAERLGSLRRVTAERHGAIRVGTPAEMAQVGRIFGAMGMYPVGFYDLREASESAVPVVSTAFRPVDADELARNPFRVFTSLLTPTDRRFFTADLQDQLDGFLADRELFGPELLSLADRAEADGELDDATAERFLALAVEAFELSPEPVDRAWYETLERVSAVAADIGGVASTHINHLTPRVLDIDALYRAMTARGIAMIDAIQGPPRWSGPDVLLRQTSFRALAEERPLREADGSVTTGALRVRFGEVEARGIALTESGRARYEELLEATDRRVADDPQAVAAEVARDVWEHGFPTSETVLAADGLAYFDFHAVPTTGTGGGTPPAGLAAQLEQGWVRAEPIVYEDFLPRSAAGIFQSNLTDAGTRDLDREGAAYDSAWMSGVLGREVLDPYQLYAARSDASLAAARSSLGLAPTAD